ncbi:hypothetical protein DQ04_09811000 [Trypanosoma grayi]|uniref:hypothetical protein n=1 Tax=Trypanosoma grayi TaxID=71804 RepID=UPI0004F48009|nr:hypothetical protein DQ04_09811000 [Trypanosoma grayi]KEG07435.1 hypothetical protein DQ04_09811000 [Trypanosoma grayi]
MLRLAGAPVLSSPTASIRHTSASPWIAQLFYGACAAPMFGVWKTASTTREENDATRVLYCKALIHASGGGRRARDWVAGCSALMCPSDTLLFIALKHNGSEQDVERYREHLLEVLAKAALDGQSSSPPSEAASSSSGVSAAQLGSMPEVRCFVYDAMKAACFHRYHKVPVEERQRLYAVAQRLGLNEDTARGIWRLVEKEGAVEREKQRALDYPWSD